jgi:AraC-like DNA-binding protein
LLAVFPADRGVEARLWELLEPRYTLAVARSWAHFARVVRERPVTGAILGLRGVPSDPTPVPVLSGFTAHFPHLPLVLLVRLGRDPHLLYRLGRAGIRNLVLLPLEDLGPGLERTVARSRLKGATAMVLRELSPLVPPRELETVRVAMESVHRNWSAEAVAGVMGLSRPHLSECMKRVGLPSLGHFLLWTRLFHAGQWLEEPGRTGESVARQLEYSSGAAFRRALKLYTGLTPTEVRSGGGLRPVFREFMARTGLLAYRSGWRRGPVGLRPGPPDPTGTSAWTAGMSVVDPI